MVPKKKSWECVRGPKLRAQNIHLHINHLMALDGVVFRSSPEQDRSLVTFLVDMRATLLILSLTFALSRAKTGTVFLRGINQASRDYVCDHRRVFKSGLRMRSHDFVSVHTVISFLHESS